MAAWGYKFYLLVLKVSLTHMLSHKLCSLVRDACSTWRICVMAWPCNNYPLWIQLVSNSVLCNFCDQSEWMSPYFKSTFQLRHSENKSCLYLNFYQLILTIFIVAMWRFIPRGHSEASTIGSQQLRWRLLSANPDNQPMRAPTQQKSEVGTHHTDQVSGEKREDRKGGRLIARQCTK